MRELDRNIMCDRSAERKKCGNLPNAFTRNFWRTRDSSARRAAVKYAVDAVNYLVDAVGSSLQSVGKLK